MAGKANTKPKVETTNVQVITCGIKSIAVYNSGDSNLRYRVNLDTAITAIKKDDDGNYGEAQVEYIDFVPRVLIAQCINHIEGMDLMYTKKKEQGLRNDNGNSFGAAELQVLLSKAKIVIERTKFEAGSEYTDRNEEVQTHENAGYNTNITGITVSDKTQARLDKMIDDVFAF